MIRAHVLCCGGTGCTSSGSQKIQEIFQQEIERQGLAEEVKVVQTGCFGLCALGPVVIIYPDGTFYSHVTPDDVVEIVDEHLLKGRMVERLVYNEKSASAEHKEDEHAALNDTVFYKSQLRVALRNCGVINPENIEEYIGMDGYAALGKALTEMTPDEVIQTVLDSGLRGRGGAGFPTGLKWRFASGNRGNVQKYVCCNADEGDPGAFMDRSILEGDPHAVIEAMEIAGYAIGADQGYVYVRAEYPIAVKRLQIAIDQAKEYGLLGENIFGTGFNFNLEIRLGAGAFVCGEETALMTSIEGKRGEPRPRPPFPAVKGLFASPTILNNVETYANVAQIILKGADWFRSMGTTLRHIIEEIGGGIPNGKKFKAAQTGGPSGGCIPAHLIDTPIDYDNLMAIGSMMGSGGLIVMDEDNCMVDIARFFLEFTVDESCGKCTPCRVGTKRLLEILDKIISGNGELEDIDRLEELANYIKSASLCGLGQTAPNPVLSTLRYFRDEYIAHIVEKRCPAGVCKKLVRFSIQPDACIGCGKCAKNCPVDAITRTDYIAPGHKLASMQIDTKKCVKCGACISNCKFNAITKA